MNRHLGQKKEARSFVIFCASIATFLLVFSFINRDRFALSANECANLNHLWKTHYITEFEFSDAWNFNTFECPSVEASMAQALFFLETTKIENPTKENNPDFYAWLKDLEPRFHKRWIPNFAAISYFETNQIDLNIANMTKNNPVIISGILIHEARHLEQGYNSHVICRIDDTLRCDARLEKYPSDGGAYNYDIYFFDQLRKFSNASNAAKKVAKAQMQYLFETKFNQTSLSDRAKYGLD